VDLCEPDQLARVTEAEPPAWVIHLAALMPPATESEMWQVNVGGTIGLLQSLASAECRSAPVVCIGSAAEYRSRTSGAHREDDPCAGFSAYGRVKWSQTLLALSAGRELGIPTMVARPFNLIGPGLSSDLVAGWLCEQFAGPEPAREISIGNLKSARDFVDVRDAVWAYWLIAQRGRAGEIYNVCTGVPTTIEELVTLLCELSGASPEVRVDSERLRDSDPSVSYGDCSKLESESGWKPRIPLGESVSAMLGEVARRRREGD
jgi:GDP-4-dehydro-6-deoxy-D-mannose reductase